MPFLSKLSQRDGLMQYPDKITSENVKKIFADAADLVVRPVKIGNASATAFFIDGLTSGSEIAEYVLQPMSIALQGTEEDMYSQCLDGAVYSAVAKPAEDMETLCLLLVNGFCVVVFDGIGKAVAFEAKTGEKRSPSAPEVENTRPHTVGCFLYTFKIFRAKPTVRNISRRLRPACFIDVGIWMASSMIFNPSLMPRRLQ